MPWSGYLNRKYDVAAGALIDLIVTIDDVAEGIRESGAELGDSNIANFWKDLTRKGAIGLNRNWPWSVFERGYAGDDAIEDVDARVV